MDQFNEFPLDVQSEILQSNPSYFRIKKNLNQNLFYNRYCNQPISNKEFISYVNDIDRFIVFTLDLDEQALPVFNVYLFNNGVATVRSLYIEEVDVDEYEIYMVYTPYNITIEEVLDEPHEEVYFDLKTTYDIISRRNCEQIVPGHNKKYVLNDFNKYVVNDFDYTNLYSYFDLCKQLIYYSHNYDMLLGQLPRIALHRSYIGDIKYNKNGDMIDEESPDADDIIKDMIKEYNFKDEIVELISFL